MIRITSLDMIGRVVFTAIGLFVLPEVVAQGIPAGSYSAGQIGRQFKTEPAMPTQTAVPEQATVKSRVPRGAEGTRFVLKDVVLEGFRVVSEQDVQAIINPLLNKRVSVRQVFALADALTAYYRSEGYILSRVVVPPQSIEGGRVRLRAVEGYIGEINYLGLPQGRGNELIRGYGEKIKRARPLTAEALERYMLLMNDLPGAFAKATLAPSQTAFAAADLTIEFSQKRWNRSLSIDNRGGRALGPWRLLANIQANDLFQQQDRTAITVVKTADDEMQYLSLQHQAQIGSEGGKLLLEASQVKAKPEDLGAVPLNIETESISGSITYTYPVLRRRAESLYLRGSLNLYDGTTDLTGLPLSEDKLRVARIGAAYDKVDSRGGINLLDVEISRGIDGLGASNNGDPLLSRAAGKVDFTKATVYAARLQSLAPRWSALIAATGQYAFDDLLGPELFGFGGEQFGRGYDPSEYVGDHGAAVKLELRYSDFAKGQPYTAYAFYDAGWVWQRTLPEDSAVTSSAGLGLRFKLSPTVSGTAEIAKPISRDVVAEGDRDVRGFLGLSASF